MLSTVVRREWRERYFAALSIPRRETRTFETFGCCRTRTGGRVVSRHHRCEPISISRDCRDVLASSGHHRILFFCRKVVLNRFLQEYIYIECQRTCLDCFLVVVRNNLVEQQKRHVEFCSRDVVSCSKFGSHERAGPIFGVGYANEQSRSFRSSPHVFHKGGPR
jgi:hypothetical protein